MKIYYNNNGIFIARVLISVYVTCTLKCVLLLTYIK